MTYFPKTSRISTLLWPCLLATSLSACSALGSLGGEIFTFEGELPPNFSLKAQAEYDVANECSGRSQVKTFEQDYGKSSQQYRFKVPVNYRFGLCEMQLGKVKLFIYGRYGEKDWQRTYDNGGLVIVDKLPEGAPGFGADGVLTKTAICTWWFQESKLYIEISKLLNCKGAGAYLTRDEMPGKKVMLSFQVNAEEEPSHDDTWVKFPAGWKPCLPKPGWPNCQKPPVFKTFRMNGRECTVYPNCTEY
ncbi:hypothetical protein GYM54_15150 [Pseudomonas sp. MTM4]|uniref:hypothetical protein n=1 Tax=unclassified Pseudomonas TaxID=196821 RepID=UPI0018D25D92|nr:MULTISPECIES: hypothetical protein [unclassified Pseudomonas]MBC8648861.1 hypothetical protein [Pseudomonas sp. MT4]QXY92832.1 hypothetical protein GYM54_15150 [Pseudomonas sp. MTM4]